MASPPLTCRSLLGNLGGRAPKTGILVVDARFCPSVSVSLVTFVRCCVYDGLRVVCDGFECWATFRGPIESIRRP